MSDLPRATLPWACRLSIQLKLGQVLVPGHRSCLPRGRILGHHNVFEDEDIHVGGQETAVSILGGADNRLAADVEAGVDQYRTTGQRSKASSRRVNRGLRSSSTV